MQTRVTDQPGFLLHRREWQNTSLILDIFSLDYGRVSLLAKGARKGSAQALYQPFTLLTLGWTGRHELKTLTAVEGHSALVNEQNYLSLLYINELIIAFLPPQEPSLEIFNRYLELLNAAGDRVGESSLREFELEMLQTLGYFPDTSEDAQTGEPIQARRFYRFHINSGFIGCESSASDSVSGQVVIDWNSKQYRDVGVRRLAKSVLRSTIDFNLDGKALKSRDVYQQIKSRT
jgi:DNA repair protein RecO (recombination protein O)